MSECGTRPCVALVAHDIHDHGGMERAFAELIRRLAMDHQIVVVSATLQHDLRPLVDWRRVPTPPRPFAVKFPWFFMAAGIRMLRVRADLVHVLGAIIPNRADIACVAFCQAGFIEGLGRLAPNDLRCFRKLNTCIARWCALQAERWCYRPERLRLFGTVSSGVAAELGRYYPKTPVKLTPNGVDVNRYHPNPVNRMRIRAKEGVELERIVALFVGGDWGRKGLAYAINGVALARNRGVDVVLWVVGPGDVNRFEKVASKASVSAHVRFFGQVEATEQFFQGADVFVLPTAYETFSLVAYEAAASGLPIVATDVSGIDELLRGDIGGILVERHTQHIADAIVRLAGNPGLRAKLGTSGQCRAQEYTWEKATAAVVSAYRQLLHPVPGDE